MQRTTVSKIHVGCSGWVYKHWRGSFYPEGLPQRLWFQRYAEEFDTVEINASFYRLPRASTFEGWREKAPPGFRYAVKVNRFITHMKKLLDCEEAVDQFIALARPLGSKLGPLLYQLPPSLHKNLERLDAFLSRLPTDIEQVVEFRHRSWYDEEVLALLGRHGIGFVCHDLRGLHSPRWASGRTAYVRFHGTSGRYRGRYSDQSLLGWTDWLINQARGGRTCWCYFNNDIHGHAIEDARTLKAMVRQMSCSLAISSFSSKLPRMADVEPPAFYEPPTPFAQQRSDLRAGVGRRIGENLDATPRLWRLCWSPKQPIQLYIGENFLDADTCRLMCEKIDEGSYPSPLYDKEKHEGVRTSYSCNLNAYDPVIVEIDGRIAELLGVDRSHGEPLQGQRYQEGQRFREHADFFYIDEPYWEQYEPHGGQRTWTAMIYLNEPKAGGATRFKLLDYQVEPKLGRILIWNNMALDGSPNPWTQHEGMPVESGTKYIVTKWYRERQFV